MAFCPNCGSPAGLNGTCGSLACGLSNSILQVGQQTPSQEIPVYLDRLKGKQATLIQEIHTKERELATLTSLIQFLTERPDVQDVAERVMEV